MTAKRTGHGVRANLRAWWPELVWLAFAALMSFTAAGGATGFAIIVVFSGMFWLMGFRHRHRPLWEVIRRMDAKLDKLGPAAEPSARDRHLRLL